MADITVDKEGRPIKTLEKYIEDMVVEEVKDAERYIGEIQGPERTKRWSRYYGKPLGNEASGRSKFISRDILETIEWVMPSLMSTFISSDPKVELTIEGQPAIIGKALLTKIRQDIDDDDEKSMYILFYQWFKDALVSDTAFVAQAWDTVYASLKERIPGANYQQMQMIAAAPDVELEEYTDNGDGTYTDIDIRTTTTTRDGLLIHNLPHWDVLVDRKCKFMNDEYGKGYSSRVTMDYLVRTDRQYQKESGEKLFNNLDRLSRHLSSEKKTDNTEEQSYMDGQGESSGGATVSSSSYSDSGDPYDSAKNLKKTLKLVQWYTRCDVDGDGVLENIICWVAEDEVLLRWELNDYNTTMMSALSPIIDCYKLFGIAFSELLLDIQNLKTMLIRRILDNFDFSSLGRTFIKPGGKVPIRELLENIPGDAILLDPERIRTEYPKPFDSGVLHLLEAIEGMKENRTGTTRYNQGTDADSLNKTAAGIQMIQSAGQSRIDMVARLFAETGVSDHYRKCAILYQHHMSAPFTVPVDGVPVTVSPEQIKGRIRCRASLGADTQIGMAEAQKVQAMFTFLASMNQVFPGIIGPEQIHNLATKYVSNMGNKQPEFYISLLKDFINSLQVTQQQMMAAQEMEQKLKQEEIAIKWAQVKIDAKKVGAVIDDSMLDFRARIMTKQMDIQQHERDENRRMTIDMATLMAKITDDKRRAAIDEKSAAATGGSGGDK